MKSLSRTSAFFKALSDCLAVPGPILITAHKDPDADAIGSCLAFSDLCKKMGHTPVIWLADPVPPFLTVLPGALDIVSHLDSRVPFKAVFALDCSNKDRIRHSETLDQLVAQQSLPVFNIDHHADNPKFGTRAWVEPTWSSTGEMITVLSLALEQTLSPQAATCLYAAITFDTGRFLFSNVSPDTFRTAAYLMESGADILGVSRTLFENLTEKDFGVIKAALENLVIHPSRYYAYTVLPAAIDQTGLKVIDVIRQLGDVSLFLSFDEQKNGEVKISLRSRDVNVQAIAAKHGGGGHIQASGITLKGTLDTVIPLVLNSIPLPE